ncbi:hypothetical protein AB0K68_24645 [Streptomyces sp. NPDC050698]
MINMLVSRSLPLRLDPVVFVRRVAIKPPLSSMRRLPASVDNPLTQMGL